eukprot:14782967-Ditylum_brightwellii.AAC.1
MGFSYVRSQNPMHMWDPWNAKKSDLGYMYQGPGRSQDGIPGANEAHSCQSASTIPCHGMTPSHSMHYRRTDPTRARRCISAVARPSFVSPCLMETRTYIQLLIRKVLQLLATRKRRISTSARLYPSCLEATMATTVTVTPGSATPLTKT